MRQSKFEKLTDDQIARFRKLWTGREPTAEIARQYDIDRATVRAWAVRPQVKKSSPLPQAGMTAISIWRTRMMIELSRVFARRVRDGISHIGGNDHPGFLAIRYYQAIYRMALGYYNDRGGAEMLAERRRANRIADLQELAHVMRAVPDSYRRDIGILLMCGPEYHRGGHDGRELEFFTPEYLYEVGEILSEVRKRKRLH